MMIKRAETKDELSLMLAMAEHHPAPEYDCPFEAWKEIVEKVFWPSKLFRVWIMYENEYPVGYIAAVRNNLLTYETEVFDIFIEPSMSHRFLVALTWEVKKWNDETGGKRVRFKTKVPRKVWEKALGLELTEEAEVIWTRHDGV